MKGRLLFAGLLVALLLAASAGIAQYRSRGFSGGDYPPPEGARTAREAVRHSPETPDWKIEPEFRRDVFTFTRIHYASADRGRWSGAGEWWIDTPDSDLNLSFRLQQMTSIRVNPDGRYIELTDRELFDYPWIYIVEPGALVFSEAEVTVLRKYLLNGGFLMVDDFWGDYQWENFHREMKRVFPEYEPEELEMSHPIFHCVFNITLQKQQMQIPNFVQGENSQTTGITWEPEYRHGPGTHDVHFRAISDNKGRMMVFIAHNTDNGDGWEREGEFKYFFSEFSEKKAYPLGINVVFYAMTH
jgi:hypothetical protein